MVVAKSVVRDLVHGPLFWALCVSTATWAICAAIFTPHQLIQIENACLLSAGCGVAAAYLPAAAQAIREPHPTSSDVLTFGIWLAWLSIPAERSLSLFGRYYHKDVKFYDTHLHTGFLAVMILAGLCHLLAPEAVAGRLPPRAWMRVGGLVFVAVLVLAVTILRTGF